MKRWLRYLIVIAFVVMYGASPFRGTDISALLPVEAVWVGMEGNMVRLETDTGQHGVGINVSKALEDLKSTAPGNVFLDTADYLIVQTGKEELLREIYPVLRPSCMVCAADTVADMEKAVEFLTAHEPMVTLRQWNVNQMQLQVLQEKEGRLKWCES